MPDLSKKKATEDKKDELETGQLILTELQKSKYLRKIHLVQLSQKQKAKKRIDRCD